MPKRKGSMRTAAASASRRKKQGGGEEQQPGPDDDADKLELQSNEEIPSARQVRRRSPLAARLIYLARSAL
eukprot:1438924-Prymnesium_polylepis.2